MTLRPITACPSISHPPLLARPRRHQSPACAPWRANTYHSHFLIDSSAIRNAPQVPALSTKMPSLMDSNSDGSGFSRFTSHESRITASNRYEKRLEIAPSPLPSVKTEILIDTKRGVARQFLDVFRNSNLEKYPKQGRQDERKEGGAENVSGKRSDPKGESDHQERIPRAAASSQQQGNRPGLHPHRHWSVEENRPDALKSSQAEASQPDYGKQAQNRRNSKPRGQHPRSGPSSHTDRVPVPSRASYKHVSAETPNRHRFFRHRPGVIDAPEASVWRHFLPKSAQKARLEAI
jgi:hypothetical protein